MYGLNKTYIKDEDFVQSDTGALNLVVSLGDEEFKPPYYQIHSYEANYPGSNQVDYVCWMKISENEKAIFIDFADSIIGAKKIIMDHFRDFYERELRESGCSR